MDLDDSSWYFNPIQEIFSHVGMFPGLNQY